MLLLVGRVLDQAHSRTLTSTRLGNVERPLVTVVPTVPTQGISTRTHQRRATCHRACEQQWLSRIA